MCTFTIEETTVELYIIILRGSPAKLMKVLRCTNNYVKSSMAFLSSWYCKHNTLTIRQTMLPIYSCPKEKNIFSSESKSPCL